MNMPLPPNSLSDLINRAAIADVIYSYAHAVDRRDWALYRSIFSDRIEIDFFTWAGIRQTYSAAEWVAQVRETLSCFDSTQHTFTNLAISIDRDRATCIVNMTARHNLIVEDRAESQTLGGFYTHHLERTAHGWRIAGCTLMITWEDGDRGLFNRARALGARARVDVGMQGA